MDHLQTRLEALELRAHAVEWQLRWWRGVALLLLALGLVLVSRHGPREVIAQATSLEQRVAALEAKLKYLRTRIDSSGRPLMEVAGANLRIVNGLGSTDCRDAQGQPIPDCPNGLGNLIVGYNEIRVEEENIRTGSHNVVVGQQHNYSRVGGLVVGTFSTISGDFVSVSGGSGNTASGNASVVNGGQNRTAAGEFDWVAGSLVEDQ